MNVFRCSYPFSALIPCGHLFADRAILQMVDGRCTLCDTPFEKEDIVPVTGSITQVNQLRERIERKKVSAAKRKRKISGKSSGELIAKDANGKGEEKKLRIETC